MVLIGQLRVGTKGSSVQFLSHSDAEVHLFSQHMYTHPECRVNPKNPIAVASAAMPCSALHIERSLEVVYPTPLLSFLCHAKQIR